MIIYLLIIGISTAVIAALNCIFTPGGEPWYMYLIMTFAAVIAAFVIDAIVAIIGRR